MDDYLLYYQVHTHLGEQLLPGDTLLTETELLGLMDKAADRRVFDLWNDGNLKKDINNLFDKEKYSSIFSDNGSRENVFSVLKMISIPYCEYEAIEYFKENDFYTYEHLLAVYCLSTLISSQLTANNDPRNTFLGSLSHDIGKCSIPLNILQKGTPLSQSERKYIEHHTIAGYALLTYYSGIADNPAAVIARDHHENNNGTGYPAGKKNLDLQTEIVIVCDIYDALLSPRPYRREAFTNRTALEELTKKAIDGQVSQEIVKALIACNRINKTEWHECIISKEYRGINPKDNNYGKTEKEYDLDRED